jgi:hypothetical protein
VGQNFFPGNAPPGVLARICQTDNLLDITLQGKPSSPSPAAID